MCADELLGNHKHLKGCWPKQMQIQILVNLMLKMPLAIMLAPLVPVQYSVLCSFFPADAKNVNHNEISQKNSITFDTFSFLWSTSNLIGNPNFLLSGLSSCTGAWVYNKSHYNANCKIGRAVKKIEQSWDFVPNRGWVGKWPFAIQKKSTIFTI